MLNKDMENIAKTVSHCHMAKMDVLERRFPLGKGMYRYIAFCTSGGSYPTLYAIPAATTVEAINCSDKEWLECNSVFSVRSYLFGASLPPPHYTEGTGTLHIETYFHFPLTGVESRTMCSSFYSYSNGQFVMYVLNGVYQYSEVTADDLKDAALCIRPFHTSNPPPLSL